MADRHPPATGRTTSGHGTSDGSPWVRTPPPIVDRAQVHAWRTAVDGQHHVRVSALTTTSSEPAGALAPGISVVIPSHQGRQHIDACLVSLAEQTLDHSLIELIVVLNGPPDGTRELLYRFRSEHPSMCVRIVQLGTANAANARNAGIATATREYTTFIDDDDYVSPAFLAVLLANAEPTVVPVVPVVDSEPDGTTTPNYACASFAEHAGNAVMAVDLPGATTLNAGKAIATGLVRNISYDPALRSGEDVLFWTTVAVRGHVTFRPCANGLGAFYYRVVRQGSVSRREPSFDFNVTQRLQVIERLERLLGEADVATVPTVINKINSQSGFLGSYLRQHPDQHQRVVTALDRSTATRLPYRMINESLSRGLVIAYAFPPYADTSAVVTAKRVRDRGEVVDVIHNAMDRIRDTDESLRRISGPFVGRAAALSTPSYFADWASMEEFATEGLTQAERWTARRGRYEWIYSRAHFAASHFLAAAYKLAHPDVSWRAEFSDPLSRDIANQVRGTPVRPGPFPSGLRTGLHTLNLPVPNVDNCFIWCEEITYALADELVFTNENQLAFMLGYCSSPELAALAREKAVISPHPTLPAHFYSMTDYDYPLEEGSVHLAYFGNFYATRGLDDVLRAMACQPSSLRRRLRLHVFTSKPAQLRDRAAELSISDLVLVGPYVRYLEFLSLTRRFDCLIVNDATTAGSHSCNPYLPSKWSDYLGSGRPVWALLEADSSLSRQPVHHRSPVGDVSAATQVLMRIAEQNADSATRQQPAELV